MYDDDVSSDDNYRTDERVYCALDIRCDETGGTCYGHVVERGLSYA